MTYTLSPEKQDVLDTVLSILTSTKPGGWTSGKTLAMCLWERNSEYNRRRVRQVVKQLRKARHMIFAEQGHGYSMCLDYGEAAARSIIARGRAQISLGELQLKQIAEARQGRVLLFDEDGR